MSIILPFVITYTIFFSAVQNNYQNQGGNFLPPPGYKLVYSDDFDAPSLNTALWYNHFLPHWSSPSYSHTTRYTITNSVLTLTTNGQGRWSPWDGNNVFSSLATGQYSGAAGTKIGTAEFTRCRDNPVCVVNANYANLNIKRIVYKYGYAELRAKFPVTGYGIWWMIGSGENITQTAEIDIFEMHNGKPWGGNCVHFGIHPWGDTRIVDEGYFMPDCQTEWATYGFLRDEDSISLFIDGELVHTLNQSPDYEMLTMVSVGRQVGQPDNELQIDWFRVWQRDNTVFLPVVSR